MKILFASDIHGSLYYTQKLIEAFEREAPQKMVLLGDLLYHGPRNDFPEQYSPKEVIPLLNKIKSRLLCVRGNCDSEVDQMVLDFPIMADYSLLCAGQHTFFITHGHLFEENSRLPAEGSNILVQGHTHVPLLKKTGYHTYLNPGSVSLPKENSARGYLLYENGIITLRALDGTDLQTLAL